MAASERTSCQERSGLLFAHVCEELPSSSCGSCGKMVCRRHLAQNAAGSQVCTSCAKGSLAASSQARYAEQDPYFYSSHYYTRYHGHSYYWDSHDFVDSDEAVLTGGEAEREDLAGFEDDMGAS